MAGPPISVALGCWRDFGKGYGFPHFPNYVNIANLSKFSISVTSHNWSNLPEDSFGMHDANQLKPQWETAFKFFLGITAAGLLFPAPELWGIRHCPRRDWPDFFDLTYEGFLPLHRHISHAQTIKFAHQYNFNTAKHFTSSVRRNLSTTASRPDLLIIIFSIWRQGHNCTKMPRKRLDKQTRQKLGLYSRGELGHYQNRYEKLQRNTQGKSLPVKR